MSNQKSADIYKTDDDIFVVFFLKIKIYKW